MNQHEYTTNKLSRAASPSFPSGQEYPYRLYRLPSTMTNDCRIPPVSKYYTIRALPTFPHPTSDLQSPYASDVVKMACPSNAPDRYDMDENLAMGWLDTGNHRRRSSGAQCFDLGRQGEVGWGGDRREGRPKITHAGRKMVRQRLE